MKIDVHGSPSDGEVAAIVAAIEMSWPQPAQGRTEAPSGSTTWRYSGRWWQEGRLPPRW